MTFVVSQTVGSLYVLRAPPVAGMSDSIFRGNNDFADRKIFGILRMPNFIQEISIAAHAKVVAGPSDNNFVEHKIFDILRPPCP